MTERNPMRKIEIIQAALELFLEKGYEKTTMQEIILKLDIAKGTIYHYFKSKDELLDAVIEEFVSVFIERLKVTLEKTKGNALERFRILVTSDRNFVEGHQDTLERLHSADNIKFHTRQLAVACTKMAPLFAQIIEQGCREKLFKSEHPLETAEFLLSGLHFLTDDGVYSWRDEDILRRRKAFPRVVEVQLGAPKGSFAFLAN